MSKNAAIGFIAARIRSSMWTRMLEPPWVTVDGEDRAGRRAHPAEQQAREERRERARVAVLGQVDERERDAEQHEREPDAAAEDAPLRREPLLEQPRAGSRGRTAPRAARRRRAAPRTNSQRASLVERPARGCREPAVARAQFRAGTRCASSVRVAGDLVEREVAEHEQREDHERSRSPRSTSPRRIGSRVKAVVVELLVAAPRRRTPARRGTSPRPARCRGGRSHGSVMLMRTSTATSAATIAARDQRVRDAATRLSSRRLGHRATNASASDCLLAERLEAAGDRRCRRGPAPASSEISVRLSAVDVGVASGSPTSGRTRSAVRAAGSA